jgi:hypothetical protein
MNSRSDILLRIEQERDRQFNLPGSERDVRNTPNDFIATACRYLSEEARRFDNLPLREDYEQSLIKAAAVILAALESTTAMQALGHFADGGFAIRLAGNTLDT